MTTQTSKGGPGKALEKTAPSPGVALYDEELAALAGDFAGEGSQDATQKDRVTPFLGLIQGLSPQIDKQHAKYIKGAEIGDLFNTVTGETYKPEEGGVFIIPVAFQKVYNVWIDRNDGGGFLGSYRDPECTDPIFVPGEGAEGTDKRTQVVETALHYVLVQGKDGVWSPAIMSMKVTQLKSSRKFNTLTMMAQNKYATAKGAAPVFLRVYRASSVGEKNSAGQPFANYKFEAVDGDVQFPEGGFATPALIKMAAEFRKAFAAGAVAVDPTKADDAEGGEQAAPVAEQKDRPKF
jgi:hypothetical protein